MNNSRIPPPAALDPAPTSRPKETKTEPLSTTIALPSQDLSEGIRRTAPPTPKAKLRHITSQMDGAGSKGLESLRQRPRISAKIRKKIQRSTKELECRSNSTPLALGEQRRHAMGPSVGAKIAWINYWKNPAELRRHREFDLYWTGACAAAKQQGYCIEEFACHSQMSPARLLETLKARNIRAMLIPPHQIEDLPLDWHQIPWGDFSLIRFGCTVKSPQAHIVTDNELNNGVLAFENMRRLGYKRIGYVYRSGMTTHFLAGFLIKQAELAPDQEELILKLPSSGSSRNTQTLLANWLRKSKPDAVISDLAQMRGMIEKAGIDVPREIGLAATNVLDEGAADAGIFKNSQEIGRIAVEMLISFVKHNALGLPPIYWQTLIEGQWVNGSSLPNRN